MQDLPFWGKLLASVVGFFATFFFGFLAHKLWELSRAHQERQDEAIKQIVDKFEKFVHGNTQAMADNTIVMHKLETTLNNLQGTMTEFTGMVKQQDARLQNLELKGKRPKRVAEKSG